MILPLFYFCNVVEWKVLGRESHLISRSWPIWLCYVLVCLLTQALLTCGDLSCSVQIFSSQFLPHMIQVQVQSVQSQLLPKSSPPDNYYWTLATSIRSTGLFWLFLLLLWRSQQLHSLITSNSVSVATSYSSMLGLIRLCRRLASLSVLD